MNLWNKKVYDVIFRLCGCNCGHGFLKLEEEVQLRGPKQVPKKNITKAQLKPELKDVKIKKAKKLSSKSALSESFKRHQEVKNEKEPTPEVMPPPTTEVYIPGLLPAKTKTKKKLRKTSVDDNDIATTPSGLNPGVMPFVPRYRIIEETPSTELCYS